jgi:hypothetical protein
MTRRIHAPLVFTLAFWRTAKATRQEKRCCWRPSNLPQSIRFVDGLAEIGTKGCVNQEDRIETDVIYADSTALTELLRFCVTAQRDQIPAERVV